jgi:predicted short-subunit dehydrogenase-like oxidoreductase (DUF2520 family)
LNPIQKIVIIGAGSVATNLAIALYYKGFTIVQVLNRSLGNAQLLADRVNASYTDNFEDISSDADLYIIAVKDSKISVIAEKIKLAQKLIVHTSGSIPMDELKCISDNYGVFYPLQTFSKTEIIEFTGIPICIEANTADNESVLLQLAFNLSGNVQKITSTQRKILHISAVFVSNFSSYLYLSAFKILEENQLSFDLLKPLILRTAEKVQHQLPLETITGPARRNDVAVMEEHKKQLTDKPDLQEIYQLISENIVKQFYKIKK